MMDRCNRGEEVINFDILSNMRFEWPLTISFKCGNISFSITLSAHLSAIILYVYIIDLRYSQYLHLKIVSAKIYTLEMKRRKFTNVNESNISDIHQTIVKFWATTDYFMNIINTSDLAYRILTKLDSICINFFQHFATYQQL